MQSGISFTSLSKTSTLAFAAAFLLSFGAEAKKTVCSATLNSDNEIRAFKDIMGTDDFEYVELTKFQSPVTMHAWFEKSCEAKVQCDILIVSGHFAGTFFGTSGLILPMEEIEKRACDDRCDGILKRPKEVFLFGCNTLAGKSRDNRSPEEYRRVLIQDGFTSEEAERMVSFRYSPFGDSFADRMRQVFSKTPRIYGNESVGPVGKDIEKSWRNYLKSAKATGYYNRLDKLDGSPNKTLMGYLDWTALSQVEGDRGSLTEQQPACTLHSSDLSTNDKILWIERTFRSGQYLRSLPHIVDFFESVNNGQVRLSSSDRQILARISAMSKVKEEILPLLHQPDDALLGMQLQLYTLMTTLKWMNAAERAAGISRIVLGDVKRPFNQSRLDRIVSFRNLIDDVVVDFTSTEIPDARWSEPTFLRSLAVLSYKSPAFEAKLMPLVTSTSAKPELRLAAAAALAGLRGANAENTAILVRQMDQSADALSRRAAVTSLANATGKADVHARVSALVKREKDVDVASAALAALPAGGERKKATLETHLNLLARLPAPKLRTQIVSRLTSLASADKDATQIALGKALLREPSAGIQYQIISTLGELGGLSWNSWSAADDLETFKDRTSNMDLKIHAATTLEQIKR